jgi:hypothetical protein
VLAGLILALGLIVVGVVAIEEADRFRGAAFTVTLQNGSSYKVDGLPEDAGENDALAAVLADDPVLAEGDNHLKQWLASQNRIVPKSARVHAGSDQSHSSVFGEIVAMVAHIPLWLLAGFAAAAAAIYTMCRAMGWIIVGFAGD